MHRVISSLRRRFQKLFWRLRLTLLINARDSSPILPSALAICVAIDFLRLKSNKPTAQHPFRFAEELSVLQQSRRILSPDTFSNREHSSQSLLVSIGFDNGLIASRFDNDGAMHELAKRVCNFMPLLTKCRPRSVSILRDMIANCQRFAVTTRQIFVDRFSSDHRTAVCYFFSSTTSASITPSSFFSSDFGCSPCGWPPMRRRPAPFPPGPWRRRPCKARRSRPARLRSASRRRI